MTSSLYKPRPIDATAAVYIRLALLLILPLHPLRHTTITSAAGSSGMLTNNTYLYKFVFQISDRCSSGSPVDTVVRINALGVGLGGGKGSILSHGVDIICLRLAARFCLHT